MFARSALPVYLHPMVLAALAVSTAASAQQPRLVATEGISVRSFSGQIGLTLTYICPATRPSAGTVWGTDVYSDSSAICQAAIHAGVLPAAQAGVVSLVMGPGVDNLEGTERNGVTSQSYGSWGSTFTFAQNGEPGEIDWTTTAIQLPVGFTMPVSLACPPGRAASAQIWGTDTYTSSSAICAAAVHSGLISEAGGGQFTLLPGGEQASFLAMSRNGVTSMAWTAYPESFTLGAAAGGAGTATSRQAATATGATGITDVTVTAGNPGPTVSWTPLPVSATYVVTRSMAGDAACCTVSSPALTGPPWQDTALPAFGSYLYRVTGTPVTTTALGEASFSYLRPAGVSVANQPATQTADGGSGLPRTGGTIVPPNGLDPVPGATTAPSAGASILSAPVVAVNSPASTAPQAANAGRYRAVITGFRTVNQTIDDPQHRDGLMDEVYVTAASLQWNRADLSIVRRSLIKTRTYGDATDRIRFPDRVQAGTAGPVGGIWGGNGGNADQVPREYDPAGSLVPAPLLDQFPLYVWEGTLTEGTDALLIVPSIWEWDGNPIPYNAYADNWLNGPAADVLQSSPVQIQFQNPNVTSALPPANPGLVPANKTEEVFANALNAGFGMMTALLGVSVDRPIGLGPYSTNATQYQDRLVVVTHEKMVAVPVGGYTVVAVPFWEPADGVLNGVYTLYVRIDRLE
jgi:LCCL domain